MRRAVTSALVLLLLGTGVVTAERRETLVRGGVPCDPPETWQVVDQQAVRVPLDPSLPDINPLPITGVLVLGSVALEPDVAARDRITVSDPAFVPCEPDRLLEENGGGDEGSNLPEG